MGNCFSQPLQKVHNPTAAVGASSNHAPSISTSPMKNEVLQVNQSYSVGLISKFKNEEGQLPEQTRPYFSFTSFMLQNENPQIYEYIFDHEIGKGSMSQVYLVKNAETEEICAAKVYNNAVLHRQTLGNEDPPHVCLQREIDIVSEIIHPNVLNIIEIIEDKATNSMIVVMPFADMGTFDILIEERMLSNESIMIACSQIADCMNTVHSLGIVHRDINPEGILVFSEYYFALGNFSVATKLTDDSPTLLGIRGTYSLLSPEEISGDPFDPKPADVWKFGITFYYAFFHKLPFDLGSSPSQSSATSLLVMKNLLEPDLTFPELADVPREMIALLSRILDKDPKKRPTFQEIFENPVFDNVKEILKQKASEIADESGNISKTDE